jgi:hypothetical protein
MQIPFKSDPTCNPFGRIRYNTNNKDKNQIGDAGILHLWKANWPLLEEGFTISKIFPIKMIISLKMEVFN